jgi:hypothetical protein
MAVNPLSASSLQSSFHLHGLYLLVLIPDPLVRIHGEPLLFLLLGHLDLIVSCLCLEELALVIFLL